MRTIDYAQALREAESAAALTAGSGRVADYIPALAEVDPDAFGMAVATVAGELYTVGDATTSFSIQSISKVFALAAVMSLDGDAIWKRVGREPSGTPFNSLVQLEAERGYPRNPMINAGALVVTDRLLELTGDAFGVIRELLRQEAVRPDLDSDPRMIRSEAENSHRNAAMAHLIASHDNLVNDVAAVLEHYTAQCAIEATCADIAVSAGFLARGGVLNSGESLLTASQTKRLNSVLLTCGNYDAAGEFAYRVGLPGKSGVGGGILAVIPGTATVCAWSPRLDRAGNSVAAVAALDAFTSVTGASVF